MHLIYIVHFRFKHVTKAKLSGIYVRCGRSASVLNKHLNTRFKYEKLYKLISGQQHRFEIRETDVKKSYSLRKKKSQAKLGDFLPIFYPYLFRKVQCNFLPYFPPLRFHPAKETSPSVRLTHYISSQSFLVPFILV